MLVNQQIQFKIQLMNNPYIENDAFAALDSNASIPMRPIQIPVEQDIRQSFAADSNPLIGQQSSWHVRSLIATIILLAGIVAPIAVYSSDPSELSVGATIGICIGSYFLYLIVSLCCNELNEYLSNFEEGSHFNNQYDRVRALIGNFVMTATCYHYETRYHTRTHTDSNGHTHIEHYTTQEKVITHTATESVTPTHTKDQSGNVDRINAPTNIIFIHFQVNYRFFDDISRQRYQNLYYSFRVRNTRDVSQDFNIVYTVPGLIEKKAFFVGQMTCNLKLWFIIFSLCGMIWPYSMWVERKISRFDIVFMKVLNI